MQFEEPGIAMVDGRRLAYEEVSPPSPKGTIMLLVGLGAKRQGWYKQLPEFGRSYRTIALDYRDVGDSDEAGEPYTIKDLAEDTAAVMRTLEIRQAHIIGISMGGFIALELALDYPEMVDCDDADSGDRDRRGGTQSLCRGFGSRLRGKPCGGVRYLRRNCSLSPIE